ncbi:hypothetical protein TNCV_3761721 [Trichonephila clavipes]|nr:hypothetical protein TNCV_3761721 [Trichonephila clavipes]
MNYLPKDLAPLWRAFQGFGATSTPVDIKPDLDEGFLTDFGKLKKDDQKFGFKKMFQIFEKKEKEKNEAKDKLSKKKEENKAQQNQRRQSYRPLSYKDTAARDEESHLEVSSTRETNESSTSTSKSTSTPTPSQSTPTLSESTPTPSESTHIPSESTTTPSESSPTPSESTTTSETTSTSSETEDQEIELSKRRAINPGLKDFQPHNKIWRSEVINLQQESLDIPKALLHTLNLHPQKKINLNLARPWTEKEPSSVIKEKGDYTIEELTSQTQNLAIVYTNDSFDSNLDKGGAGVFFISSNIEHEYHKIQVSIVTRLRTKHIKGMKPSTDEQRSYTNHCSDCPNVQLSPQHILSCCPEIQDRLFKMSPEDPEDFISTDKVVEFAEAVEDSFGVI